MIKNIETKHLKIRWIHLFSKSMHKFFVNKNVLDIGCLDGYSTNQFIKNNAKDAIGIDIDLNYLNKAKEQYKDINFSLKNAENLVEDDFKNIDVVSCLGLIYLLKNPTKFLKLLSLQQNSKTVIIETVVNNDYDVIQNDFYFINTDLIKDIFITNGWVVSLQKEFTINSMDVTADNCINFGKRIILVFEKLS